MRTGTRTERLPTPTEVRSLPGWAFDLAAVAWLALVFFLLCRWSWRKWPDLYIDFGRELYVPWQLAQGKVLYRDVFLEYGPISKYFLAYLFQSFGESFQTVFVSNLVLLAAFTMLLYFLSKDIVGRFAATAATTFFLCVFAFSQYVGIGNYNFASPYSHEAVHGVILSFGALYCLGRSLQSFHWGWLAGAGLLAGGVLLTKPELGVSLGGAVFVYGLSLLRSRELPPRIRWQGVGAFGLGACALPLAFFLYFQAHVPAIAALKSVAGAWTLLFESTSIGRRAFDLSVMGTDDAGGNASLVLVDAALYILVLGGVFMLCYCVAKFETKGDHPVGLFVVLGAVLVGLVGWLCWQVQWIEAFRPLPVLVIAATILAVWVYRFRNTDGSMSRPQFVLLSCWAAFGFLLLLKMILNSRVYHYGFYLAMPATLLVVVVVLSVLPKLLPAEAKRTRIVWYAAITAALICCGAKLLLHSSEPYRAKGYPIGAGGDRMLAYYPELDGRTAVLANMLEYCKKHIPAGATLACMPEGIMVNYLLRRENPVPAVAFGYGEQNLWGEENLIGFLQKRPPDFILLIHRDHSEFGVNFFGLDPQNGQKIMQWIRSAYQPVHLVGNEPFQPNGWGMLLLKRKPG